MLRLKTSGTCAMEAKASVLFVRFSADKNRCAEEASDVRRDKLRSPAAQILVFKSRRCIILA